MSVIGRGSASRLWWAARDVERLRHLVTPLQRTASVYLASRRLDVDGAEDLDLRIRSLQRQLEPEGVDQRTAAAIDTFGSRVGTDHAVHAVFIREGVVLHEQTLFGAAPFDRARFATPPVVTPVLRWLFARPPHVIVITDRAGAEITSVSGGGGPRFTSTVVGPDDEITALVPRGWSQPRYQRRVEDAWRHNASAVADATLLGAEQIQAELVLITGDVRAVHLTREALHRRRADLNVRELATSRRSGLTAVVAAAVADDTTARTGELLQRMRDSGGPAGLATEGAAETIAALAAGRVDVLIVTDEADDDRLAWCDADVLCSLLRPERSAAAVKGRMVDVAVRAALLSDAEVCVLPDGHPLAPAEGIGAICRYPVRSD
jgi:release factor family 2